MIRGVFMLFILLLIQACALHPLQGLRGAPAAGVWGVVIRDCYARVNEPLLTNEDCTMVSRCAELKARNLDGFDRYFRRTWRAIDQIAPWEGPAPHSIPISQMRLNAERAGPHAVDVFNTIMDIRHQCLIETGLRDVIDDS